MAVTGDIIGGKLREEGAKLFCCFYGYSFLSGSPRGIKTRVDI